MGHTAVQWISFDTAQSSFQFISLTIMKNLLNLLIVVVVLAAFLDVYPVSLITRMAITKSGKLLKIVHYQVEAGCDGIRRVICHARCAEQGYACIWPDNVCKCERFDKAASLGFNEGPEAQVLVDV